MAYYLVTASPASNCSTSFRANSPATNLWPFAPLGAPSHPLCGEHAGYRTARLRGKRRIIASRLLLKNERPSWITISRAWQCSRS